MDKKVINDQFVKDIEGSMGLIRNLCYRKVVADRGGDFFDPAFDLLNFKVTKRQVADSLDSLPTSIRSSMVVMCQSYFNAIHEA